MDAARVQEVRDRLAADDPRGALRALDAGAATGPDDAEASYWRSVSHFRLGAFADAEQHARRAISLDASHGGAFYYLGLSTERQGRTEEALAAYRVVLALEPGHQKAAEKLRSLGSGGSLGSGTAAAAVGGSRPGATEFTLPTTDDEFDSYERTIRRKALIDARAEYTARHRALPGWVKVLMGVVALAVVAVFVAAAYVFVDARQSDRSDELDRQVCEQARQQGIELPGC